MIRIFAVTKELKPLELSRMEELNRQDLLWYWVEIVGAEKEDTRLLEEHFHFHPLAIEDAIYGCTQAQLEYYEDYVVLVLNALNEDGLEYDTVSLFVSDTYIVSYHVDKLPELEDAWEQVSNTEKNIAKLGPAFVAHQIMDSIIHGFFPAVHQIEDLLDALEKRYEDQPASKLVEEVFRVRRELLRLRRTINAMRDLLYRIIHSERLTHFQGKQGHFRDLHNDLTKLAEMIESSRDMTSDMRDSYISINANRMNTHMMVLTVITTIFIPLSFIAGIYGMNFEHMPELNWRYGYFISLIVMVGIGVGMFLWFKRRGWFDI